jgi:hypothetical protein
VLKNHAPTSVEQDMASDTLEQRIIPEHKMAQASHLRLSIATAL